MTAAIANRRPGVTLIEVLVAIFVMGIGLICWPLVIVLKISFSSDAGLSLQSISDNYLAFFRSRYSEHGNQQSLSSLARRSLALARLSSCR